MHSADNAFDSSNSVAIISFSVSSSATAENGLRSESLGNLSTIVVTSAPMLPNTDVVFATLRTPNPDAAIAAATAPTTPTPLATPLIISYLLFC